MVGLQKLDSKSLNNIIINFFKLIRYKNILIITITQIFSYFFLNDLIEFSEIFTSRFLYLIGATFLSAAAGYIINDYMDIKLDMVNKPKSVIIGKYISRRWAIFLHSAFNILAITLAWFISYRVALLVFICSLFLWLYSQFLKKSFLLGNILVALMTASTIFILIPFDNRINFIACLAYSIFAFFSNLIREIVKDTEDIKGDFKFKANTIPIKLGVKKTKNILVYLQIVFIVGCLILIFVYNKINFLNYTSFFSIYILITVLLPSIYILFLMKKADIKKDFTLISFLLKLIMILGILSMVFWKLNIF